MGCTSIEEGVKNVYSSDNYKQYLSFLTKFHNYSFNNTMLILSQKPDASMVAGFYSWKENFHRYVNKGEKAIQILAPYQVDITKEVTKTDENGFVLTDDKGQELTEEKKIKVTKFRMVNVFDISQTGGEPIPELVSELEGTSLDSEALIQTIEEVAMIPIEYIEPENDGSLLNGAKGYYSLTDDKIVINANLSTIQKAKTLTHEYAHSCLHKKTDLSTDAREIEAEALAFVICDHFNIDTSDYSFPYIASYANKDIEFLKETLVHIQKNAHEYISTFEPIFDRYLNQLKINSKYMTPLELESFSSSFILELKENMDVDTVTGFINATDSEHEYIIDAIREMVNEHVNDLETKYPGQCYLYECDAEYRNNIHESLYQAFINEENPSRPFITNSTEHQNYKKFIKVAAPMLQDDVTYMKFSCPSHLDFNVEKVIDDRIAISHYFELNGDLMADPDIELSLDTEHELLIPHTYQLDAFGIYQTEESHPKLGDELKTFIGTWLNNISDSGYRLSEIHSDGFCYDDKNNLKELQNYCKEHGISHMMPKRKELER